MTDVITIDFTGFNTVFASEGDIRPHHYRQRVHFEKGVTANKLKGKEALDARLPKGPGLLILPEPFENLKVKEAPNNFLDNLNIQKLKGYRMADITRETIGPCIFSTVYYPHNGKNIPDVRVKTLTPKTTLYRDDRYHAILIEDGKFHDIWFVQKSPTDTKRVTVENFGVKLETDAPVVFLSLRGNKVVSSFRTGGSFVRLNGKKVAVKLSKLDWYKRPQT